MFDVPEISFNDFEEGNYANKKNEYNPYEDDYEFYGDDESEVQQEEITLDEYLEELEFEILQS